MVRRLKNPKKAQRKNKGSKKRDGSSLSSAMPSRPTRVCQPGVDEIEKGEELQCDPSAYNSIHAFHVDWPCLRRDVVPSKPMGDDDSEIDSDSSDSDDEDDELGGSKIPVLQQRKVTHQSCVNRIRPMPQSPHICASWSESGYVQPNATLVMAKKGVPYLNKSNKRRDQLVRVQVEIPKRLSHEERKIVEQLAALSKGKTQTLAGQCSI